MASESVKQDNGSSEARGGVEVQHASSIRRKVRRACGILFLLLAAALLITSVSLRPLRNSKQRACLREGLKSGQISPEALDPGRYGESTYDRYYKALNRGSDLGDTGDPYMDMCRHKYDISEYSDPTYIATAAALAVLFAVAFFTHTTAVGLGVILLALLVDAAVWAAAYSIIPVSRKKFRNCMKNGLASGEIVDLADYEQHYEYNGASPFSEVSTADPGIERCESDHTPALGTLLGAFLIAFVLGCGLFVYLVVRIILFCCQHQAREANPPQNGAAALGKEDNEGLPVSAVAPDEFVVVPLSPSKV